MSKRTSKTPAPKSTKPAAKKAGAPKKDAATPAAPRAPKAAKPPAERDPRLPAVGQTITKDWRKKTLKVLCTKEGFEYAGKPYTSLSAVAKEASGFASVNGFLFFGLVPRAARPAAAAPKATAKAAKGKKPAEPKIGGEGNDIGTAAGQRAALAAAGVAKATAAKADAPESKETK